MPLFEIPLATHEIIERIWVGQHILSLVERLLAPTFELSRSQ
jgi:hypothetical protein